MSKTMEIRIQFIKDATLPDHRIGSPFGFTEMDWEYVQEELARVDCLKVVMWQTYTEYSGDGEQFFNHQHAANLRELIERALERKRRRYREADR